LHHDVDGRKIDPGRAVRIRRHQDERARIGLAEDDERLLIRPGRSTSETDDLPGRYLAPNR
jgi:hypothetical protein